MQQWVLEREFKFSGTTSEVASSSEAGLWLASPAGLYRLCNGRWQLVQKEVPFWHITSVAIERDTVLVAGLPKGILRSPVRGRHWEMAWVEQSQQPITSLLPSPNVQRDGVWLAGTRGDGILRSTDNGRHWELNNWGLRDFNILDLIAAPQWEEREYAFALTVEGVYQSPNGGRAWRYVGESFEDDPAQAIAVSNDFADDQTVWVGCEDGTLFCSNDRGRCWTQILAPRRPFDTITTLAVGLKNELMIGAGQMGIFRLGHDGRSVSQVDHPTIEAGQYILRLRQLEDGWYANLVGGGMWWSEDGERWTVVSNLTAGRFLWLDGRSEKRLIGGPHVGVWVGKQDDKKLSFDEPLLAATLSEDQLYLSRPSGLYRGNQRELQPKAPLLKLLAIDKGVLGLGQDGRLWHRSSEQWRPLPSPPEGDLVALAGGDGKWLCATYDPQLKEGAVWQQNVGETAVWQTVTTFSSSTQRIYLDSNEDRVVVAWGRSVREVMLTDRSSTTKQLASKADPLIGVATYSKHTAVASLTTIWHKRAEEAWQQDESWPKGESIANLMLSHDRDKVILWVLTGDGRLWSKEIV